MHKFHTISPQQFLDIHRQPKNLHNSVPCFGTDQQPIPGIYSHQAHDLMQKNLELKTQTAPNFLGSHGHLHKSQKIPQVRSHVLGPIKRPLTASNQPKHRKTLKNGNKTQVGRKYYLLELSKTRKPGVHA